MENRLKALRAGRPGENIFRRCGEKGRALLVFQGSRPKQKFTELG